MTKRKIAYWVIPPEQDAECVACMEEVLETYAAAYDPKHPVRCMDEQPVQWLKETPHSPGFSGKGCHRSAKPSGGKDLDIEEPVACRYAPALHFHTTQPGMLGSTLIRYQVVQVRQACEKRLLTSPWMMKPFHHE